MLERAAEATKDAGVEIDLVLGDASTTRLDTQFDSAICICEGAFSLLEQGVEPLPYHEQILSNIHAQLKPGGHFLLTALSAFKMIREHSDADVVDGTFDLVNTAVTAHHPGPDDTRLTLVEKGFMPAELRALIQGAGLKCSQCGAGLPGTGGRDQSRWMSTKSW